MIDLSSSFSLSPYPVYVDMGPGASATAVLSFTFTSNPGILNTAFGRQWDIKVTQLACTDAGT